MPAQPRQQPRKPSAPAKALDRDAEQGDEDKGNYGARINRLFRDAIRDLEALKQGATDR